MDWNELEQLYMKQRDLEKSYYSSRYKYWKALQQIKKSSPHKVTWKTYSGKCRRLTKKLRVELLNSRPKKSYELDHVRSILYCYIHGISIEECCVRSNLKWIPKATNRQKGILCDESNS